jgi:hypothetical protein
VLPAPAPRPESASGPVRIPWRKAVVPVADRRRPWLALVLAFTLALAGCGISTHRHHRRGRRAGDGHRPRGHGGPASAVARQLPARPSARCSTTSAPPPAELNQVKSFLTENALKTFRDPANKDNPAADDHPPHRYAAGRSATGGRTRSRSRTGWSEPSTTRARRRSRRAQPQQMTSRCCRTKQKPACASTRSPGARGLMLIDQALDRRTTGSADYFWDSPDRPRSLVPDLRYLPLTITAELRASGSFSTSSAGPRVAHTGLQRCPLLPTPASGDVAERHAGRQVHGRGGDRRTKSA